MVTLTRVKVNHGKVIGLVRKLSAASKYSLQTANGTFSLSDTRFAATATGELTVQEGQATVLYTAPGQTKSTEYALVKGQTFKPEANDGQGAVLVTSADVAAEVALQLDGMVMVAENPMAKRWAPTAMWNMTPRPFDSSRAMDDPPWQIPGTIGVTEPTDVELFMGVITPILPLND